MSARFVIKLLVSGFQFHNLPTSDPREKLVALSRKKETYARRSIIAVKIGGDLGVLYSINFITIRDSRYIELQIT